MTKGQRALIGIETSRFLCYIGAHAIPLYLETPARSGGCNHHIAWAVGDDLLGRLRLCCRDVSARDYGALSVCGVVSLRDSGRPA